jgi:FKBP-type peptidyl-prolyl cis-trans isomerase
LHVGGKRHLVIPPELDYGAPKARMVSNAKLIFGTELLDLK